MSEERSNLINAQDAARILGISPRALYRLASEDAIAHYRIGRSVRFHPDDITNHASTCRHEARESRKGRKTRATSAGKPDALADAFKALGIDWTRPKPLH